VKSYGKELCHRRPYGTGQNRSCHGTLGLEEHQLPYQVPDHESTIELVPAATNLGSGVCTSDRAGGRRGTETAEEGSGR
jgi:hypothetical protein